MGLGWWLPTPGFSPVGWIAAAAYLVSALALGLFGYGFYRAIKQVGSSREKTFSFYWVTLILGIFFCQIVVSGLKKLGDFPHYFNAIWIPLFLFISLGLTGFEKNLRLKKVFWTYLSSLFICFVFLISFVHRKSGNRDAHYGATLKNLVHISEKILSYPNPSSLTFEVHNRHDILATMTILQKIDNRKRAVDLSKSGKRLIVRYTYPLDTKDGHIEVAELD
jgi:hypothetical membrane protein